MRKDLYTYLLNGSKFITRIISNIKTQEQFDICLNMINIFIQTYNFHIKLYCREYYKQILCFKLYKAHRIRIELNQLKNSMKFITEDLQNIINNTQSQLTQKPEPSSIVVKGFLKYSKNYKE